MANWQVIFLGAEGCAEAEGQPWLRDATETEVMYFITDNNIKSLDQLKIDGTGRPYFAKAVDVDTAPEYVVEKAQQYLRVLRF